MASINKVILIGNLGADPEVRYTQGGQAVCNFNIATNERWKDKTSGQPEERTEWHRVVVWGKLAELCRDYLAKGRTVYLEGRLQTRKWEKDGQTKYTTETKSDTTAHAEGDTGAHQAVPASEGPPPFNSEDDVPF